MSDTARGEAATVRISPSVVKALRERAKLSLPMAVEEINKVLSDLELPTITSLDLEQWERGNGTPAIYEAEAIAAALLVPFSSLFAPKVPPDSKVDFRRGSEHELTYPTMKRLARFEGFYRLAREVAAATGAAEEVSVPPRRTRLPKGDEVEELAQEIRGAVQLSDERQLSWNSPEEAFEDLRACVESSGVFFFTFPMPVNEVRAASRWDEGGPPAILVNTADSVAARLFSAMHEYAHLTLTSFSGTALCDPSIRGGASVETAANRVSAATLVPRHLLEPLITSELADKPYDEWPRALRTELKDRFRVSHPVIGIRLTQLGFAAAPGPVKSFWKSKAGFGRSNLTTGQRYRKYLGHRTVKLAATAVESERLSLAELSRILGVGPRHIGAALGG